MILFAIGSEPPFDRAATPQDVIGAHGALSVMRFMSGVCFALQQVYDERKYPQIFKRLSEIQGHTSDDLAKIKKIIRELKKEEGEGKS